MCSYHQPQQIINEKTIPSHGSVFKPRPCFGLLLCKVGFRVHTVSEYATRSFYVHFAKKEREERKRHTVFKKNPLLGDL